MSENPSNVSLPVVDAKDVPETPIVLLAGNPNTGKTSLFNALSGLRAKTANYAGVTVDLRKATLPMEIDCAQGGLRRNVDLIDLPGQYSLQPTSPEETLSSQALRGDRLGEPSAIVIVVDSTNLTRNLTLATAILELGRPSIVVLSLIDAAEAAGIKIDCEKLSTQLGCPVVPVSVKSGRGLDDLMSQLAITLSPETVVTPMAEPACPVGCSGCSFAQRFEHSESMVRLSVSGSHQPSPLIEKIDEWLTAPWAGTCTLAAIMLSVFVMIFSLADVPMSLIESFFGWIGASVDHWLPVERFHFALWFPVVVAATLLVFAVAYRLASIRWRMGSASAAVVVAVVVAILPIGDFRSLIVDGVIGGIAGVVVFLPQICILFFLITLLEDSGYMARAAFVTERWMRWVGLPGKAFVPMLSAHACAIPGIMAARTIENWRDRLVTILVLPLLTCSARLPVYAMLAALLFGDRPFLAATMFAGAYLLGLSAALVTAFCLRRTIITGKTEPLVIELPPYRRPSLQNALMTTWDKASVFLRNAGSVILLIAVTLWAMATYPKLPEEKRLEVVARMGETGVEEIIDPAEAEALELMTENAITQEALEYSCAGRLGKFFEPVFSPLGFDWKINVGVMTSFAAREVLVSSLSVVYGIGEAGAEDEAGLVETLRRQKTAEGKPVFTTATCFSLLVFYVLAMQCLPTQAVTRRETGKWRWAIFQLVYMTALAYFAALGVYQLLIAMNVS